MSAVCWGGEVPTHCQVSGRPIDNEFVDGICRVFGGQWCIMHPDIHKRYGYEFGTGRAQKFQLQPYGVWVKVEG